MVILVKRTNRKTFGKKYLPLLKDKVEQVISSSQLQALRTQRVIFSKTHHELLRHGSNICLPVGRSLRTSFG